jgi:hypothetical protein
MALRSDLRSHTVHSTLRVASGETSGKSVSGGKSQARCSCRKREHHVREAAVRFLKVVRFRFSIPKGELPDIEAASFDRYLLYILNTGAQRPSLPFPRSQTGWEGNFPTLVRMGRRHRVEFAASLASFKRGLPQVKCELHDIDDGYAAWSDNACREQPPTSSPGYLRFVRKLAKKEFRFGWDDSYDSFCRSFVPSSSSRFTRLVSSIDWWRERCDWTRFQSYLRGKECPVLQGAKLRYKGIKANDKIRKMGIPTCDWDLLGPLHKTMYQHMASKEWLLRGTITQKRISSTCKGEFQTSVDLVSATDGLRQDVAQTILTAVLSKAKNVPGRIRSMACEYQVPRCRGLDVTHGQNMGTYLSFPLLCFQSYAAARWAARNDANVSFLVNGDDTIISGPRPYKKEDYPEGFILNDKKTARQKNFVEINSTQFLRQGERWIRVPALRRGAYLTGVNAQIHMAAVCQDAGSKWVEALVRTSDLGKIPPSQLGLDLRIPSVYQAENRIKGARFYCNLNDAEKAESRFDRVPSLPTSGDRWAFHKDLFEGGREGGREPVERTVSRVVPYRVPSNLPKVTCTGRVFGFTLTRQTFSQFHTLRALKEKKKEREETFCYSRLYESPEESEFF